MDKIELKPLSNEECIEYIKNYLLGQKIKPNQIETDGDMITFEHKNTVYHAYVEDYENIHYGVIEMFDVDLDQDFWEVKDEYGDYKHIDEFFETIVKERHYEYVRKTWKILEKLEADDEMDDVRQIICKYFGLFE